MNDEKLLKEYIREALLGESMDAVWDTLRDVAIPAASLLVPAIGGWARQKIADLRRRPSATREEEFEKQVQWVIEDFSKSHLFDQLESTSFEDPRRDQIIQDIQDKLESSFLGRFGHHAPWENVKTPMDDLRGRKTPSHSGYWAAKRLRDQRRAQEMKKSPLAQKAQKVADSVFGKPNDRVADFDLQTWDRFTSKEKLARVKALRARTKGEDK